MKTEFLLKQSSKARCSSPSPDRIEIHSKKTKQKEKKKGRRRKLQGEHMREHDIQATASREGLIMPFFERSPNMH